MFNLCVQGPSVFFCNIHTTNCVESFDEIATIKCNGIKVMLSNIPIFWYLLHILLEQMMGY